MGEEFIFRTLRVSVLLRMAANTCDNCGAVFANRYQLGPHRRVCVPVITAPTQDEIEEYHPQPLYVLAQRQPGFGEERQLFTNQFEAYNGPRTRSYIPVQRVWAATVIKTHACVDPRFWKIFKNVMNQTVQCRDSILTVTKDILLAENALQELSR